jgi:hypothetical protein
MIQRVFGTQALVFLLERDSWLRHKTESEQRLHRLHPKHNTGEAELERSSAEHCTTYTCTTSASLLDDKLDTGDIDSANSCYQHIHIVRHLRPDSPPTADHDGGFDQDLTKI